MKSLTEFRGSVLDVYLSVLQTLLFFELLFIDVPEN